MLTRPTGSGSLSSPWIPSNPDTPDARDLAHFPAPAGRRRPHPVGRRAAGAARGGDPHAGRPRTAPRFLRRHHGHLTKIAGDAPFAVPEIIAKACTQVAGTRECHVFQGKAKSHAAIGSRPPDPAVRLPEVEVAGGKRPLNSRRSVILPAELLEAENIGASGIIRETGGLHEIRWFRPGLDHLVAFTIDPAELRQRVDTHLREWLAGPFAPLRESGELVSLTGPGDVPLVTLPASSRTSSPSLAASARPSNSAPPPASPTRWWKACSPSSSPCSSAAR